MTVRSIWCSVKRHEGVGTRTTTTNTRFFQKLRLLHLLQRGRCGRMRTSPGKVQWCRYLLPNRGHTAGSPVPHQQRVCVQPRMEQRLGEGRATAHLSARELGTTLLRLLWTLRTGWRRESRSIISEWNKMSLWFYENGLLKAINNQKRSRGLSVLSLSICCLQTIGSFIHHAPGDLKWLRYLLSHQDKLWIYVKFWWLFFEHLMFTPLWPEGWDPAFPPIRHTASMCLFTEKMFTRKTILSSHANWREGEEAAFTVGYFTPKSTVTF